MSAHPHVVCVGDVMADILARLPGPLAPGSDTPASIEVFGGGAAGNTASWLDHLGTSVTLVGRIGPADDPFRAAALGGLRRDVAAGLVTDPVHATGRCLVLVGPDGERTMVPDAGANAFLAPADLNGHFEAGRHLHLSGYPLFGPARDAGGQARPRRPRDCGPRSAPAPHRRWRTGSRPARSSPETRRHRPEQVARRMPR